MTQEFNCYYRKFAPLILAKCRKILANEEDAQDALQEVVLRMHANFKKFKAVDSQVGWIYRVATNVCLNILRTKRRKEIKHPESVDSLPDSSNMEADLAKRQILQPIMKSIPRDLGEILIMSQVLGMSQNEIAEVLGKSRMTISRRFRKLDEFVSKNETLQRWKRLNLVLAD